MYNPCAEKTLGDYEECQLSELYPLSGWEIFEDSKWIPIEYSNYFCGESDDKENTFDIVHSWHIDWLHTDKGK